MDHLFATREIQIERKSFTIRRIPFIGFSDFTNAVAHVSTEATYPGLTSDAGISNH